MGRNCYRKIWIISSLSIHNGPPPPPIYLLLSTLRLLLPAYPTPHLSILLMLYDENKCLLPGTPQGQRDQQVEDCSGGMRVSEEHNVQVHVAMCWCGT